MILITGAIRMNVDIWSDIVCPFCYIGKRNFEKAVWQSGLIDEIEVTWRSFELSPGLKSDPEQNIYEYLAAKKGWTLDYAKKANNQVSQAAKGAGLDYRLEKTFPVNSFNAHRLLSPVHPPSDAVASPSSVVVSPN